MQKKPKEKFNTEGWLMTYTDMISLIMCFFLLLYAISDVDKGKYADIIGEISNWTPDPNRSYDGWEIGSGGKMILVVPQTEAGQTPAPPTNTESEQPPTTEESYKKDEHMEGFFKDLQNHFGIDIPDKSIEIILGDGFVFIIFKDSIFFDGDSSVLKQEGKRHLTTLAAALMNMEGFNDHVGEIRVLGHTNQVLEGIDNPFLSDRKLSGDRATVSLAYLQGMLDGFDGKKLTATGHGQYYPIVKDWSSEPARARNRRVEVLIANNDKAGISLDEIYEHYEKEQYKEKEED